MQDRGSLEGSEGYIEGENRRAKSERERKKKKKMQQLFFSCSFFFLHESGSQSMNAKK